MMPREYKVMKAKVRYNLYSSVWEMAGHKQEQFDGMINEALRNLIISYDIATNTMQAPVAPPEESHPCCPICSTPVSTKTTDSMPIGYCIVCMKTTAEVQIA